MNSWWVAALMFTCASMACSQPPLRAAEHPAARAPVVQKPLPAARTAERCGLVKRANRTWVGFGPGMTLDDMEPAGHAAADVVRAVDAEVCALLQRGDAVAVLEPHRSKLKLQVAEGGGFEVISVVWQDAELLAAKVALRGVPEGSRETWFATVMRRGEAWRIEAFANSRP